MDTDFKDLALQTIISQYGASPHIKALVENIGKHISPTADIELFFNKIFNVETAQGVGLDIWGRIVGAERSVNVQEADGYFGYRGSGLDPWNISPFFTEQGSTSVYRMDDIAFRKMILYKALANITDSTLPSIKSLMSLLYGKSVLAIEVTGIMHLRIIFTFFLESYEYAIMRQYGLLNRGAGVSFEMYEASFDEMFGFDDSGFTGFDNGVFDPYGIVQG